MIKLELMDWKKLETDAEEALRQAMVIVEIHKVTLKKARKEVLKLGGKLNEEEGKCQTS